MTEIGDALRGARAYLTDHPDEARYRDSAATARVEAGLAVTVDGPDGATLRTDMPPSIGGGGRLRPPAGISALRMPRASPPWSPCVPLRRG